MAKTRISVRSPNSIDMMIGKRLRHRREELALSQVGLAERAGVAFQQIQKYERGTNRVAASRLFALASALEVPLSYFFEPAEQTMKRPNQKSPISANKNHRAVNKRQ